MPLENVFGELALEATLAERFGGGTVAVTATVTASGDTTLRTPAAGARLKLFWVTAVQDPSQSAQPVIGVRLGSTEVYRSFVIGHWETFVGAVDAPLIVSLDVAGRVAVTAHLKEIA